MAKMVANGNQPMQADMWSLAASEAGHTVPPKTAGDWLRRSSDNEYGYILRHGDSYNVSQGAIEKFNLKASEPPLEVASDSSA